MTRLSVHIDKSILAQLSDDDIRAILNEWDIATKGMKRADVIVLPENVASSVDLFAECSIKPLVIYQPRLSLPEFSFDQISLMQLHSILDQTKGIATKVKQLLEEATNPYMDIFYAGLAYAWSRDKKIVPMMEPLLEKGYGYPFFDTVLGVLNPKKNMRGRDIFNFLAESGFMMPEHFEIAHTCPRCESILLLFRDACLNCGSPHIEEEPLVHHFTCGFQSAESHYLVTNEALLNEYFCPKCRKPLRHFGVDYDKPGVIYFCTDCNESNSETKTALKCLKCNYVGSGDESIRLNLLSYELSNMGKKALFSSDTNIFNAHSLLAEHVPVIPFDVFVLLAKKLTSLRQAPMCSLISIAPKGQNDNPSFDQSRGIYEIAKAVSRLLRKSDSVTYYVGTVFVLFAETQAIGQDKERLYKKDDLKNRFDESFLSSIDFQTIDIDEFLHRYGERA